MGHAPGNFIAWRVTRARNDPRAMPALAHPASDRRAHHGAMPASHFSPWKSDPQPCWWCTRFDGMCADGSAALCHLPNAARVRSQPASGCSAFEREVGADDVPDQAPSAAGLADLVPVAAVCAPVQWAP